MSGRPSRDDDAERTRSTGHERVPIAALNVPAGARRETLEELRRIDTGGHLLMAKEWKAGMPFGERLGQHAMQCCCLIVAGIQGASGFELKVEGRNATHGESPADQLIARR